MEWRTPLAPRGKLFLETWCGNLGGNSDMDKKRTVILFCSLIKTCRSTSLSPSSYTLQNCWKIACLEILCQTWLQLNFQWLSTAHHLATPPPTLLNPLLPVPAHEKIEPTTRDNEKTFHIPQRRLYCRSLANR